ncbi:MAG: gluconeogenesis factor YvcK family protein [Patescibacteria group bacterium]
MGKRPKIVVIGGGTGTYQVLLGLKKYPVSLTAIVTMSDSGGSSGRLREQLGILPPGDIRRALLALSGLHIKKKTLAALFDFRFNNGELAGHSLGNLLLAALVQITGREDLAISEAEKILEVSGTVLPVTTESTDLVAQLADGTVIKGETNIDVRKIKPEIPIEKVYLLPKGEIFPKAKKAILSADLIVLGPGDLYTSIIPNLLVSGVNQAIEKSKAKVVYICNLMTKDGETSGFAVSDFLREIRKYLGEAGKKLSLVVVNKKLKLPVSVALWYKKYKSEPVRLDLEKISGVKIITGSFAQKGKLIRHDPEKIAKALMKLL